MACDMDGPRTEQVHSQAKVETVVGEPTARLGPYAEHGDPENFLDPASDRSIRRARLAVMVLVVLPLVVVLVLVTLGWLSR